jgi:type I restriction enzyme S subunit
MIAVPPLAEQEAIASALSDADALIESLEQLLAKKRLIKQGAMQELLTGKRRLAGFTDDWNEVTLGDIGEAVAGLTYAPRDVSESGTLVLRASNVQNSQLEFSDNVYVDMDAPERVFVREGDILICVRNGSRDLIGKCALVDRQSEYARHAFGAFMCVYRTEHSAFVFQHFQSSTIASQIHAHLGATINQITNKSLKSFSLCLPSKVEQAAISEVLADMDNQVLELEKRLQKSRQLKQAMMQQLLTGRIRLV